MRRPGLVAAAATAVLLLAPVAGARAETFSVENTNDAGNGSLRQAINQANAAVGGPSDVVDATGVTGQINLQTALPNLTGRFEILGPGASALTVRRANMSLFRVVTINAGARIRLHDVTIANGSTAGFDEGGGIRNGGDLTVLRSAVSGNSGFIGGGIANRNNGTVVIRDSTVSGNTATADTTGGEAGGGILNRDGTVTVVNSTVTGNDGLSGRGGGLLNSALSMTDTSTMTVRNSTVSANEAGSGPNLLNQSNIAGAAPMTLRSTIISDPRGDASNCGSAGAAGFTSQGYNLASDETCGLTATADQQGADPDLGPLADNGGETRTMALPPTSPAVDKGIGNGLTTDQRDLTRPVDFPQIPNAPGGDGTDIGAFEVQVEEPPEPPSNEFSFGKVKKNKRKGTAKLTVNVPGPGELDLTKTKKVKGDEERADAEGSVKLLVKSKGKKRKKLRKKGKAKIRAAVTYTPDGGDPNTKSKRVKLKRKPR